MLHLERVDFLSPRSGRVTNVWATVLTKVVLCLHLGNVPIDAAIIVNILLGVHMIPIYHYLLQSQVSSDLSVCLMEIKTLTGPARIGDRFLGSSF